MWWTIRARLRSAPFAAILALALPYLGTFTKIFAEILDEAPRSATSVLSAQGASLPVQLTVLTWQALPDLLTYALYRLECAIRSSAVLGFIGIPTTGYEIATAFEDGHYREIWTHLYALLALVIAMELLGSKVRRELTQGKNVTSSSSATVSAKTPSSLAERWRARSKSHFLRVIGLSLGVVTFWAWLQPFTFGSQLSWERRWTNFQRFLGNLVPSPVQDHQDWGALGGWVWQLLSDDGTIAVIYTVALGTAAAFLAGAVALTFLPWASRQLSRAAPWQTWVGGTLLRRFFARALQASAMVGRALPEYLLAFLLLPIFGPNAWPLILALLIHNGGILLRLGAEVIDNSPPSAPRVALASGGTRFVTFVTTLLPLHFNRLLLFLFYRWETCLREATVLGVLGVASLGALIAESRARLRYDELFFWMLVGSALVMAADLTSEAVRRRLR